MAAAFGCNGEDHLIKIEEDYSTILTCLIRWLKYDDDTNKLVQQI